MAGSSARTRVSQTSRRRRPDEPDRAQSTRRVDAETGAIRIGIGGWVFEPWRGSFYPKGLPHAQELSYASRCVTTIEINGTFYRTQSPKTFAKWAREVPDDFVFAVKAPRAIVGRRVLAETEPQIERFLSSGVAELGPRLGPLLWQLAPTHRFDADDLARFFDLLPDRLDGFRLRHALEVRHESFQTPAFIELMRERNVAIVYAEHATYPGIADLTIDLVYARLQKGRDDLAAAYPEPELKAWAQRLLTWAGGGGPPDLPLVAPEVPAPRRPRDVFAFVIHDGKVRAPAAAEALISRLG